MDPAPEPFRALAAREGLAELGARYGLGADAVERLEVFARLLSGDPLAPTSVRDPARVLEDHLADSLIALELECVRSATSAVDIGSGAGLPGLPLAITLPRCSFILLESSSRKCSFLHRAIDACSVDNAEVVQARAEEWEAGLGWCDVALVRAVGRLDVVLEYAAPLMRVGGWLVAWRGQRDPEAEVEAEIAAVELGLQPEQGRRVLPYEGARQRHLHLFSKVRDTPSRFPRRPGMATKRPLGISGARGRRSTR
ncbi:MAG TPA: 16S rRNA (guanine(527)-N(7))-methyltransferase RsmG [Solirubrobacteraceae bacterium]|nr:16S rRNA (guanine(527)-N(7))-methyltransferase RsmG [Solirubrobacteraceae bacterium]